MKQPLSQKLIFSCALVTYSYLAATPVYACAVCFGDPDSPMSKGLFMGMAVLLGVIVTVLIGIVGTTAFWFHRAKQLTMHQNNPPSANL